MVISLHAVSRPALRVPARTASIALWLALAAGSAAAHGRIIHPPRPGPPIPGDAASIPGRAGPRSPTTPASGPTSPPPTGSPSSSGSAAAPSTPTGDEVQFTHWFYWWQLNQALYLDLAARFDSGPLTGDERLDLGQGVVEATGTARRPSPKIVREVVTPALLEALASGGNDLETASMIALAKLGGRGGDVALALGAILPRLASGNQEVSETAALAMGMLRDREAVPDLIALLEDGERGRELVDGGGVPERTRAFAAFGLGLIGGSHDDPALRRRILLSLTAVLEGGGLANEEVPVACVSAIGLLPLPARPAPPRAEEGLSGDEETLLALLSRRTQLAYLVELIEEPSRSARLGRLTKAHVPLALARLCSGAPADVRDRTIEALLRLLRPHARVDTNVVRGTVLALGVIDAGGELTPTVQASLDEQIESRDPMTRAFALLSASQYATAAGAPGGAGRDDDAGALVRKRLLALIADSRPTLRPWIPLAAGIYLRAYGDPVGALARALLTGADECRSPEEVGAWSLGLGLQRHPAGEERLLERLDDFGGDQPLAFLATGLGMLGDHQARAALVERLAQAQHRPELLLQASIALALLHSRDLTPQLLEMLATTRGSVSQAGVARALGLTGDGRALGPLLAMLADDEVSEPVRAFAAIGLGLLCDQGSWPWNAPYSIGVNYAAATSCLIGEGRGLLEIL